MVREGGQKPRQEAEKVRRPGGAGAGHYDAELQHQVCYDSQSPSREWRKWSCAKERSSARDLLQTLALARFAEPSRAEGARHLRVRVPPEEGRSVHQPVPLHQG
uniref:(northern house mosquito) hypothetical protein n=1 Tax=Culex pipiens TaxID=7175 RepID=A0A8D8B984_CULPI